jgi:hypothetical protein
MSPNREHIHLILIIYILTILLQQRKRQKLTDFADTLAINLDDWIDTLIPILSLPSGITSSRKWYIYPRSTHWAEQLFVNEEYFLEADFRRSFRMSYQSFEHLHQLLQPYIEKKTTTFRKPLPSKRRLAIFLYHITQGAPYTLVSNQFGCGKTSVSKIVGEVSKAIVQNLSQQYIHFSSHEDALRTMQAWQRQSQIPGIVACMDGCHIPIRRPCYSGATYYNRKCFYSLNVQGVFVLTLS